MLSLEQASRELEARVGGAITISEDKWQSLIKAPLMDNKLKDDTLKRIAFNRLAQHSQSDFVYDPLLAKARHEFIAEELRTELKRRLLK